MILGVIGNFIAEAELRIEDKIEQVGSLRDFMLKISLTMELYCASRVLPKCGERPQSESSFYGSRALPKCGEWPQSGS